MNIQLNEKIFTESDVDAFLASADSLEIEDRISNHCNVVECSYTGNGEWLVDGEEHDYRDVKALIIRQPGFGKSKQGESEMVKILIETGNAAFEDEGRNYEIARILGDAASMTSDGVFDAKLYDYNGNHVGVMGGENAAHNDADVQIEFDTGNAAFEGGKKRSESGRILREAAMKVERGDLDFKLMDVNGNTVGQICEIRKKQQVKPSA